MTHIVTVPLVVAQRTNGSYAYAYKGSPLPDDLADGEVKRLLEGEFVEEVPDPVIETEPEVIVQTVADDLNKMTKAQLAEVAAAESIDLSGAKTAADQVAAITDAREAAATPVPAGADSSNL